MVSPLVLGIETSCDETGIGLVRGHDLLADAVASSVEEHARFGGVVPEVASRAHLEAMLPTFDRALAVAGVQPVQIDAVAVTAGPGLAGALLVAAVWIGNLGRLAEALRRAAAEDGRLVPPSGTPLLPAVEEIAEGVARLARTLAERGELVGRLRRADEAIVESLPDPLLVLSPARVPLRANAAARAIFGVTAGGAGDVAALLRHPALAPRRRQRQRQPPPHLRHVLLWQQHARVQHRLQRPFGAVRLVPPQVQVRQPP